MMKKQKQNKVTCKVCTDKRRERIEKERAKGLSYEKIHKKYKISVTTLVKHFKQCLKDKLPELEKPEPQEKPIAGALSPLKNGDLAQGIEDGFSMEAMIDRLKRQFEYGDRMLESLNDHLIDPDDPQSYFVGPRAYEIDVVYLKKDPDTKKVNRIPQKSNLQDLLDMIEDSDKAIINKVDVRSADPTKLLGEYLRVNNQLCKDIMDMRNKDISWALEAEKIRMEKEAISRKDGEGMSVQEQLDIIAKKVGPVLTSAEDAQLIKEAGLPLEGE